MNRFRPNSSRFAIEQNENNRINHFSPSWLKAKTSHQNLFEINGKEKDCVESTVIIHRSDSLIEYPIDNEFEMCQSELNSRRIVRQRQCRIIRDRKAARSLFILVIVFLIFLFPYVICATASTAGANISPLIFEISFWLLWLNSTCNPFLYPFIQIKYRKAYVKLFRSIASTLSFSTTNRFL